jgi:hypothetical protein
VRANIIHTLHKIERNLEKEKKTVGLSCEIVYCGARGNMASTVSLEGPAFNLVDVVMHLFSIKFACDG